MCVYVCASVGNYTRQLHGCTTRKMTWPDTFRVVDALATRALWTNGRASLIDRLQKYTHVVDDNATMQLTIPFWSRNTIT